MTLKARYNTNYKVRCAETNKCKSCPRQNDNPTSLICRACTREQRETRAQRTRDGLCVQCVRPQDPSSRQLCTAHLIAQRERVRKYRRAEWAA